MGHAGFTLALHNAVSFSNMQRTTPTCVWVRRLQWPRSNRGMGRELLEPGGRAGLFFDWHRQPITCSR